MLLLNGSDNTGDLIVSVVIFVVIALIVTLDVATRTRRW